MTEVTLEFLARQNERILHELANMRVDIANMRGAIDVLTAMSIRHETSIQTVVTELQAIHQFNARLHDRVRKARRFLRAKVVVDRYHRHQLGRPPTRWSAPTWSAPVWSEVVGTCLVGANLVGTNLVGHQRGGRHQLGRHQPVRRIGHAFLAKATQARAAPDAAVHR
jgi:hypothetical protein